jgi:hypothetical protein
MCDGVQLYLITDTYEGMVIFTGVNIKNGWNFF